MVGAEGEGVEERRALGTGRTGRWYGELVRVDAQVRSKYVKAWTSQGKGS